ncbi:Folylpolyglutamate synthase [Venustampulla echinocandica]|uniref:tetrahydrofolate synthase n=1 Tax=Venustampulla echinocandica TaxID=2656787 RepID=A0A370T8P4_9HELO|nr:Folylpolyglutamate synthase [Venustampulla echinocandica]RDL29789.1 Folylpolyglutamate synthase [Venustampulla echinocandica]
MLNTLQTPYQILKQRREAGIKTDESSNQNMRKCLAAIGYSVQSILATQNDLAKLNVIHVAGTKGKGSTCAYVDSMLSWYRAAHGLPKNIGLYTSPHLVAVRERIRINSAPLTAPLFAKYFFEVWDRLEAAAKQEPDLEKPLYFRYLTLLSFHVFLQEGVDAASYEVGVGGEYDSTNIVERPAVTGITTLGIDHVYSLGDTVGKIAWHKAGIQKKRVPSFTVAQNPDALDVIEKRAAERHVGALKLDPAYPPSPDSIPRELSQGIEKVVWRGRCEAKTEGNLTWYLDGAHTTDSVEVATKWFSDESSQEPASRVLVFNQQGFREAVALLEGLQQAIAQQGLVNFDHVIFCATDQNSKGQKKKDFVNNNADSEAIAGLTLQKSFAEKWRELDPLASSTIGVLPSVKAALAHVRNLALEHNKVHAFLTGSVHLVGTALCSFEGVDALSTEGGCLPLSRWNHGG